MRTQMLDGMLVAGVDEAGRGPLAGPVVAAAVILCEGGIAGLDDSKKLSQKRRAVLETEIDHTILFETNRQATARAIHKAMHHEPSIDWLLANQHKVPHYFHQLALDGQL